MGTPAEATTKTSSSGGTRRLVAWGCAAFSIALTLTATILYVDQGSVVHPIEFTIPLAFVAFAVVGALVTTRAAGNPVGPLLLAVGTAGTVSALGASTWVELEPALPGRPWAALLGEAGSVLWIAPLTFVLYRFPDGEPLSPRWRRFERVVVVAFAIATLSGLFSPEIPESEFQNPIGIDAFGEDSWLGWAGPVGWFGVIGGIVAAAVSVVLRFRRSRGEERARLKWLALAAALIGIGFFTNTLSYLFSSQGPDAGGVAILFIVPFFAGLLFFPFAVGIGILRHRLFDIDLVISKAVVFGLLGGFIAVVYVGVVLGVGWLVGSVGSPALSALAAAVVALAFQPARRWAQRLADQLVYGERASPYQVLSEFSDRLADAYSVDDVLPRMAKVLAEATGASSVRVWLRAGGGLREAARWPGDAADPGGESDPVRSFEVRHQGEPLGAITIAMPPSEPITEAQERLVTDVASQAGLVLRNAGLIADLRASRQRLVAAQDEERRRIERNIHDGAQQQLVALAVKLRLLEQLAPRDAPRAAELASQLQVEAAEALNDLRDLARGIYPPLLADKGLVAALEAQARKSPITVDVTADGVGRYPLEVESALYFCCLEALQNVGKYASATRAQLRLFANDGQLRFEVIDDGKGFEASTRARGSGLQGMADRLDALGGVLEVRSSPGAGTTVSGHVPVVPAAVPSTSTDATDATMVGPS